MMSKREALLISKNNPIALYVLKGIIVPVKIRKEFYNEQRRISIRNF